MWLLLEDGDRHKLPNTMPTMILQISRRSSCAAMLNIGEIMPKPLPALQITPRLRSRNRRVWPGGGG